MEKTNNNNNRNNNNNNKISYLDRIIPLEVLLIIFDHVFPQNIYNFMLTNKACYFSSKYWVELNEIYLHIKMSSELRISITCVRSIGLDTEFKLHGIIREILLSNTKYKIIKQRVSEIQYCTYCKKQLIQRKYEIYNLCNGNIQKMILMTYFCEDIYSLLKLEKHIDIINEFLKFSKTIVTTGLFNKLYYTYYGYDTIEKLKNFRLGNYKYINKKFSEHHSYNNDPIMKFAEEQNLPPGQNIEEIIKKMKQKKFI